MNKSGHIVVWAWSAAVQGVILKQKRELFELLPGDAFIFSNSWRMRPMTWTKRASSHKDCIFILTEHDIGEYSELTSAIAITGGSRPALQYFHKTRKVIKVNLIITARAAL